jgi:hypothetical protein
MSITEPAGNSGAKRLRRALRRARKRVLCPVDRSGQRFSDSLCGPSASWLQSTRRAVRSALLAAAALSVAIALVALASATYLANVSRACIFCHD